MASVASYVGNSNINGNTNDYKGRSAVSKPNNLASYRVIALAILLAAGLVMLLVTFSTMSAKLQTENNELMQQNSNLEANIDSLNEQIVEQTKIETITTVAVEKLGMVYPTSDNCINIDDSSSDNGSRSLAEAIKNEVYN